MVKRFEVAEEYCRTKWCRNSKEYYHYICHLLRRKNHKSAANIMSL